MRGQHRTTWVCLAFALASITACGGSEPSPKEPEPLPEAAADSPDDVEQTAVKSDSPSEGSETSAASEPKPAAEPVFTDNMSVNEAINAVPLDTPVKNVEAEVLGKPLSDPKVYESCKLGSAHFKLKVAVWDGRAVGVDATTTPKNDKLAECIKSAVRQVTWPDKVKSLNTVEYQF